MNLIGKAFLKAEVVLEGILLTVATLGIILHFTIEKDYLFFTVISFFFLACVQMFSGLVQTVLTWKTWYALYLIAVIIFWLVYIPFYDFHSNKDINEAVFFIMNIVIPYTYAMAFFLKNMDTINSFREETKEVEFI